MRTLVARQEADLEKRQSAINLFKARAISGTDSRVKAHVLRGAHGSDSRGTIASATEEMKIK